MFVIAFAALVEPAAARELRDVFDEHAVTVWRTLLFLGVHESEVADVSQEVFLVIHKRLPSFEGRSALSTWIHGICVRCASAYRRKAYRRRELPVDAVPETEPPQGAAQPERTLENKERLDRLAAALATLDEGARSVFVLFEIEGVPMKSIAETLEIPLQTAYSRLKSARTRVRASFEEGQS